MNIVEEQIEGLNNEPPVFKGLKYPISKNIHLPKNYFILAAIGQRGSGKSFSIVKTLSNMEKYGYYDHITNEKVDIRHILFSPTFKGNPIFSTLKYLDEEEDVINEYTDNKLYDVLEEIKLDRKLT